jgi:hypothetical protein
MKAVIAEIANMVHLVNRTPRPIAFPLVAEAPPVNGPPVPAPSDRISA